MTNRARVSSPATDDAPSASRHLPTPGEPRRWQADVPWVQDMVIAHRFYRLGLTPLPALVEAVRDGDRPQAGRLQAHYQLVMRALNRHQAYENAHIWPTIARRSAGNLLLAERPLDHHRVLAEQAANLEPLWAAWVAAPTADTARPVRDRLVVLIATMNRCLDEEEADLLPLIERHLTVAEWAEFGRYSAASASRRQLWLMAGMVASHLSQGEWEDLNRQRPGLRWAVVHVAVPSYRRYARRLGLPVAR